MPRPPAKKRRVSNKTLIESAIQKIKKQFKVEVAHQEDITVGSIDPKKWQENCEYTRAKLDFFNIDISKLKLLESDGIIRRMNLSAIDLELRSMAQRIVNSKYQNKYCDPYQPEVYEVGGFLKQSPDGDENQSMILMMQLPTECEGGDLVIDSRVISKDFVKNKINYALFKVKQRYSITRVTNGKRIFFSFKVFDYPGDPKITGKHCYSDFTIPKSYKNILFTYPKMEMLENMLTNSKLKFEQVFFKKADAPGIVYSNIGTIDELDQNEIDSYNLPTFEDLIHIKDEEDVKKYKIENWVDVGKPEKVIGNYSYCAERYEGSNSGDLITVKRKLIYYTGYLVNPVSVTE